MKGEVGKDTPKKEMDNRPIKDLDTINKSKALEKRRKVKFVFKLNKLIINL